MQDVLARRPSSAAYKTENVQCETGLYKVSEVDDYIHCANQQVHCSFDDLAQFWAGLRFSY